VVGRSTVLIEHRTSVRLTHGPAKVPAPTDPFQVAEGRSGRWRPRPDRIGTLLVRAGSARHRRWAVLAGHERSQRVGSTAGRRPCTSMTSAAEAPPKRVRTPQPPPRSRVIHLRFLTSAQLVARMIGGRLALELQRERGVDLEMAQQEGGFVESPAPQPAGDFGVALAGVA
jgi:hypothetical protein